MKVFNFFIVISSLLTTVMSSCSNEELDNIPKAESKLETKAVGYGVDMLNVAQLLTIIDIDQSVMDEVKRGVERSLSYGLDEEYRFTDMLNPGASKLRRSTKSLKLIEKMNEKLNSSRSLLKTSRSNTDFFNFLSENDIQIYWPYSEDWDGKTLPTITYNPENGNEDWNYGFVYKKDENNEIHIDTVVVDEDYFQKNPVWIINRNETKYTDLPNFENGEYVKNGVIFDQPVNDKVRASVGSTPNWTPETDPNLIYSFYIQNMRVYNQLDGGLAGGSEMVIKCAYPEIALGMPSPVTVLRKDWTRKEISNSTIKAFSTPLISNWRQEQLQCGLKIIEEDNGSDRNWDFKLGVTIKGINYGVDASIPFNNNDDEIVETVFDRVYINSKANTSLPLNNPIWGIWKMYSEGGVAYSLPIKTTRP